MAAARVPRVSDRRRASPPQLERAAKRDGGAAVGVRRRAGADRRTEVQDVDQAGPAAEREEFYYLRLHGRNAARWWKHDASEDRYNYLYTAEELEPFAEAAKAASREVKKAYLYANNHFSAKSVANAAILKTQLGQKLDGEYPEEFIEEYPDLKGLVKILPGQPSLTSRKPS